MDLAKVEEERESSILEDAIPLYNYYYYNKMDHQRVVMALNRLSPEDFRRAMHIIMTDEQHKATLDQADRFFDFYKLSESAVTSLFKVFEEVLPGFAMPIAPREPDAVMPLSLADVPIDSIEQDPIKSEEGIVTQYATALADKPCWWIMPSSNSNTSRGHQQQLTSTSNAAPPAMGNLSNFRAGGLNSFLKRNRPFRLQAAPSLADAYAAAAATNTTGSDMMGANGSCVNNYSFQATGHTPADPESLENHAAVNGSASAVPALAMEGPGSNTRGLAANGQGGGGHTADVHSYSSLSADQTNNGSTTNKPDKQLAVGSAATSLATPPPSKEHALRDRPQRVEGSEEESQHLAEPEYESESRSEGEEERYKDRTTGENWGNYVNPHGVRFGSAASTRRRVIRDEVSPSRAPRMRARQRQSKRLTQIDGKRAGSVSSESSIFLPPSSLGSVRHVVKRHRRREADMLAASTAEYLGVHSRGAAVQRGSIRRPELKEEDNRENPAKIIVGSMAGDERATLGPTRCGRLTRAMFDIESEDELLVPQTMALRPSGAEQSATAAPATVLRTPKRPKDSIMVKSTDCETPGAPRKRGRPKRDQRTTTIPSTDEED
ncbi:hypothetical protein S40293_11025 [Stachybotrys chartarum IBT 40293]|nr:hypothetical protein S40293_11025 [Stachybotrys chartarum IBT 40293]